ncbi:MAG: DNA repair protein RadA, partial [Anaerolineales bacterium]|nr:DNA repair protein RadA [Anaerolineales bacterium]
PAADLAIAVAVASSAKDRPVHADMAFIGEIGLSGELRAVSQLDARLREAEKLGFKRCIVPRSSVRRETVKPEGMTLITCRTVAEALDKALLPE